MKPSAPLGTVFGILLLLAVVGGGAFAYLQMEETRKREDANFARISREASKWLEAHGSELVQECYPLRSKILGFELKSVTKPADPQGSYSFLYDIQYTTGLFGGGPSYYIEFRVDVDHDGRNVQTHVGRNTNPEQCGQAMQEIEDFFSGFFDS